MKNISRRTPNALQKRAQLTGSPAALAIILVMLFAIVAYFLAVPEPYRRGYLEELPVAEYNNIVLDASPGRLEPSEEKASIKKIELQTVVADNTPQIQKQLISEQILIKKSLFKLIYEDYDFKVNTTTFSAARLHFVVSEKKGEGIIKVRLNKHTIFSRQAGTGETLDISLPQTYLHEGMNTLHISVLGGSIFQTKSYLLSDVNLETDSYLSKPAEQSFFITQNVAKNIEEAKLTAYVKQLGENVGLEIELNDEQIFNTIPPATFSLDLPIDLLQSGSNTLNWLSGREGEYKIQYGLVIIKELEIEEGGKRYYFSVSEKDMYFAVQTKKYTCELYLLKTSGADEITITLNSEAKQYAFENGEVKEDICSALKEGTNKIVLSVEEDTAISDLMVTVKNKVTTS